MKRIEIGEHLQLITPDGTMYCKFEFAKAEPMRNYPDYWNMYYGFRIADSLEKIDRQACSGDGSSTYQRVQIKPRDSNTTMNEDLEEAAGILDNEVE